MCGIVGFSGKIPAAPVLLKGLERLEYRGYDSAGIAVFEGDKINIKKAKGKLETLNKLIDGGAHMSSTIGIGHTRWATHGKPSDVNAHPHYSMDKQFAVVHNGIIENYSTLKEMLVKNGVKFVSETDTEVVAQLLQQNYTGDLYDAIVKTVKMLEGSYALGILCADCPDVLYAVKHSSPLIAGVAEDGFMVASDIPAVLPFTRNIYYLNDNEIVKISGSKLDIMDYEGNVLSRELTEITWDVKSAEKGGYEHFMIKEIMEQPKSVHDTFTPRIKDGRIYLDGIDLTQKQLRKFNKINIVACGSAYHVGVVGKYVLEQLTRIPVICDVASEFRYQNPIVDENSLVIIISQSGETADTKAALEEAKRANATILSIVNVVGSSIATLSDNVLYTWAGPEISVATTKAYSTQLIMMYLIAIHIGLELGKITGQEADAMLKEIETLPDKIQQILDKKDDIAHFAQRYAYLKDAYFIGRNIDYAVSLEASLKLKETSYIHSDAYAAGELKHGPISLIEDGTLVIGLACNKRLMSKTISNIEEVKARGAEVMLVVSEDVADELPKDNIDRILTVPVTDELFSASLEVIPMQLLAYYIAKARECDVDKPRNLAKSVTVE